MFKKRTRNFISFLESESNENVYIFDNFRVKTGKENLSYLKAF